MLVPVSAAVLMFLCAHCLAETKTSIFNESFVFPAGVPFAEDRFYCIALTVPANDHEYITAFYPQTTDGINHHIKIGECDEPGFTGSNADGTSGVFNCYPEDNRTIGNFPSADNCAKGWRPIYFWTPGVDPLIFPEGVGYRTGHPSSKNITLMIQVHYGGLQKHPEIPHVSNGREGMILSFAPESSGRVRHGAKMFRTTTYGALPAHSVVKAEGACRIEEPVIMHPFIFCLHAHWKSLVISGWKISPEGEWSLIGKADPLGIQAYFPVTDKNLILQKGDIIASRCTFNNTDDKAHRIANMEGVDEMCNFAFFYYEENDRELHHPTCDSIGPPAYTWAKDPLIGHVPDSVDQSASHLDFVSDDRMVRG